VARDPRTGRFVRAKELIRRAKISLFARARERDVKGRFIARPRKEIVVLARPAKRIAPGLPPPRKFRFSAFRRERDVRPKSPSKFEFEVEAGSRGEALEIVRRIVDEAREAGTYLWGPGLGE
jgi:hypothetical protein